MELWKSRSTASTHVASNISLDFHNHHIENIHFLEEKGMPNNMYGKVHSHNYNIDKTI